MVTPQATDPRWQTVYWIAGAPDTGKSTVAKIIAERHQAALYHYDQTDVTHHELLAQTDPEVKAFLQASMDERWLIPTPQELADRTLKSFYDRFPLVVDDLLKMPREKPIFVEGFGLLPTLVKTIIPSARYAAFLVPSAQFKAESMDRRDKPKFANETSDPDRVRKNVMERDALLVQHYKEEVARMGYLLITTDGSRTPEQIADQLEEHFGLKERNTSGK